MRDPSGASGAAAEAILRALRHTRQIRQFTDEPVTETDLGAILETIISLGHPTEAAQQPRSAPGTARRPIADLVRER